MLSFLKKNTIIASIIALSALSGLTLLAGSQIANAAPGDPGTVQVNENPQNPNEDGTTCAVEKIGWFVCPIVESSAKIGDNMFSFLADNFLQTEPALISSGDGNGTKTAWELARNTANILFIIVFIIVIYSQITSTGLSNYGIKRMMPRLIIVAIAMNLSYLICQLVVDLTNTLGYAIMDWLVSLSHTVFSQSIMPVQTPGTNNVTDVSLLGTMATVAIASAVVWMLIGPLIGTIGLIVATCIAIVVILLLRKTFIILLVVVSPLAFVAYLLPNTEKLFSKWLNMFWKLLLVFPIVAMLMGGGQLASAIILASGHSAGYGENAAYKAKGEPCVYLDPAMKDEKCEDGEGPGIMLALVAAGVAVAPLLAVFAVMKGALAAAGAIGGKIAQGVQKGSSSGVSGAQKAYKESSIGKWRSRVGDEKDLAARNGDFTGSKKNPLNWKRRASQAYYNKMREVKAGQSPDRQYTSFAGHVQKGLDKEENEYIRSKAQDAISKGTYWSDYEKALGDYGNANTKADQDRALQAMKINRMAIGSQEGRAGMDDANAMLVSKSGSMSSLRDSGSAPAIIKQAHAAHNRQVQSSSGQQNTPQPPVVVRPAPSFGGGSGAGTPSSATSGQTSARQANNVAPGAVAPGLGGRSFRQAQAGNLGRTDMDDAALISAAKEASRGAANGSTTHEDVGQKIIEEMKSRGIDPTKHI